MTLRKNMIYHKYYILLTVLTTTSAFSVSYLPQAKGRKLFGGYRIVPKVCRPTHPSRTVSNEPSICMFNHECTKRNGEVVGACMDGFLFGACCQLPSDHSIGGMFESNSNNGGNGQNIYDLDHVPEIPILLNPDGTPMMETVKNKHKPTFVDGSDPSKPEIPTLSDLLGNPNTKTSLPGNYHNADVNSNSEKNQLQQVDVTNLQAQYSALFNQQSIIDDLQLPGLITHSDSNNGIQDNGGTDVDTVTTFLEPDQVVQISDPVYQLPELFSQGANGNGSGHSTADTILFNENGSFVTEVNNPDDIFTPGSITSSADSSNGDNDSSNYQISSTSTKLPIASLMQIVNQGVKEGGEVSSSSFVTESYLNGERVSYSSRVPKPTEKVATTTTRTRTTSSLSNEEMLETEFSTSSLKTTSSKYPFDGENDNRDSVTPGNDMTAEKSTKYISSLKIRDSTTPMSPYTTYVNDDEEFVRVPTINHESENAGGGNKKDDVIDQEEASISHIISLLNNSDPSPEPEPLPEPNPHPDPHDDNSGIQTWGSIDGTSVRPSEIKYSSIRPTTKPETTVAASSGAFPYTFYKPSQGSVYYEYEVSQQTESSLKATTHGTSMNTYSSQASYPSSQSTSNIYSNRPSSNPPAPTVIVLGPLGTEFINKVDQKNPPRRQSSTTTTTVAPVDTKKPSFSTTITHNINTVISTNNAETNNTRVVSSSYISVDLKDGATSTRPVTLVTETTTKEPQFLDTLRPVLYQEIETKKPPTSVVTLSGMWSEKPTFHLKPLYTDSSGSGSVSWTSGGTSTHRPIVLKDPIFLNNENVATPIGPEDETTAPDEFNNFPPVRNPNLNMSSQGSQQEKPTIIGSFNQTFYPDFGNIDENDIPTPAFIENDVLDKKVDNFVNKIVESLQSDFDDLGDIVYKKRNATTPSQQNSVTRKPTTTTTSTTTRRTPIRRPATSTTSQSPNKKPNPTKRPPTRISTTTQRVPTASNKPTRPIKVSTAKPKPIKQSTTTAKPPQTVSKRPKPVRKPTVPPTLSTETVLDNSERPVVRPTQVSATSHRPNYRTDCGVRPLSKTGRIVGGKGANFGDWPWQVLIREATWLGLFTKNKCGGVLITNKFVTTAAHCQPGFLGSLVAVLGEFDITGEREPKNSVSRNIKRVIVHRNYDPATFENDLALLEMETPVQFDTHIVPICMPDDDADFTGRMATVTGWGRLKYSGGVPSILQEVQVPIMENSVCQEMFLTSGHEKRILDSFLCAGYANGQKDSCEGDSGGPLTLQRPDGRWELAGTVSHGIKCAVPYLPGVYMRTTYFKPWLHSVTGV